MSHTSAPGGTEAVGAGVLLRDGGRQAGALHGPAPARERARELRHVHLVPAAVARLQARLEALLPGAAPRGRREDLGLAMPLATKLRNR